MSCQPGLVSTFRAAGDRASTITRAGLQKEAEQAQIKLRHATDAATKAMRSFTTEKSQLDELLTRRKALERKAAAVLGSSQLEGVKEKQLQAIERDLHALKALVKEQKAAVAEAEQTFLAADQLKDQTEAALHALREPLLDATEVQQAAQAEAQAAANARKKVEKGAITKLESRVQQRARETAREAKAVEAERQRLTATARAMSVKANERVKESAAVVREANATGQRLASEAWEQRAQSVLSLKQNTTIAAEELKGVNERRAKAAAALAKAEKAEAREILLDGGNPYEEFRRRKRDADVVAAKKAHADKVAAAKMRLADQAIQAETRSRGVQAAARQAKEYEREYLASLSRPVVEGRTAAFIASKTKGGVDVIDPTGRAFDVKPSQVTVMKTHAFGLGKTSRDRPDVLEKVLDEPWAQGVTADPRWVPKRLPLPGEGGGEQPSEGGEGSRLVQRQLSVLEQKYMSEALERQRGGLVEKQVVLGREYEGCGFLPAPTELDFKDFEVGQRMTRRIVLTNVSYTFNNFKVLPLPPHIRNFFDVVYTPPGRLSAGMTCPITVHFNPKTSEDIFDNLKLIAKTGPIDIPLRATCKKAVPVLSSHTCSIGRTIRGEMASATITVENQGALPFDMALAVDGERLAEVAQTGAYTGPGEEVGGPDEGQGEGNEEGGEDEAVGESMPAVWTYPPRVSVGPYSKRVIKVEYRPRADTPLGAAAIPLRITYNRPELSADQVLATAETMPVALYVEDLLMDFRTCFHDKLYRGTLVLRNRGNVALKMAVATPRGMCGGVLEFVPNMGFVQAHDKATGQDGRFEVAVKFRPPPKLLQRKALLSRRPPAVDTDTNTLTVPVTITAPDQALPVVFVVRAQLTSPAITLSPAKVNFGRCFLQQATRLPISIRNTSALPQKLALIHPPPYLSMAEGDGFMTLLPNETVTRHLVFAPTAATDHACRLRFKSTTNQEFSLSVMGAGVDPPFRVSHTLVQLPAVAPGEVEQHQITLSNVSGRPQCFHWIVPSGPDYPNTYLRVAPAVGQLAAGESRRIQLEFAPPANLQLTPPASDDTTPTEVEVEAEEGGGAPADGQESKVEEEEGKEAADQRPAQVGDRAMLEQLRPEIGSVMFADGEVEEPSVHCRWTLACFAKPAAAEGKGKGGSALGPEAVVAAAPSGPQSVTMSSAQPVEVHTAVVAASLVADCKALLFGQVSVGQPEVRTVRVTNVGRTTEGLRISGLNPTGGFRVINIPREVEGGRYQELQVEFVPRANKQYVETLTISSLTGGGRMEVVCMGTGVSPCLEIASPEGGVTDFGHVVCGDEYKATYTLRNTSVFPLTYRLRPTHQPRANLGGRAVFRCTPDTATIQPGDTMDLSVTAYIDYSSPLKGAFEVVVPNQESIPLILLRARPWPRQMFALPAADAASLPPLHPSHASTALDVSAGLQRCILDHKTSSDSPLAPAAVAGAAEQLACSADSAAAAGDFLPTTRAGETPYSYVYRWAKGDASSATPLTKSLVVGCAARGEGRPSANGAYEVILPADAPKVFLVPTPKAAVNAGAEVTVAFQFDPTAAGGALRGELDDDTELGDEIVCQLVQVGQWVETVATIQLTGGTREDDDGVPAEQKIRVKLAAFVYV